MDVVILYLVFVIGLGSIHYKILLYIVYITCSRMIVLYSLYWVVFLVLYCIVFVSITIFLFLLPLRMGFVLGVYQLMGRSPL